MVSIEMSPVYGGGDPTHENAAFWHATPQGKIALGCANRAAADRFETGKQYYVDFTPAE